MLNIIPRFLFAMLYLTGAAPILAEEISRPDGKSAVISMDEKFTQSMQRATTVVLGQFQASSPDKVEKVEKEHAGFVEFKWVDMLKGEAAQKKVLLIPIIKNQSAAATSVHGGRKEDFLVLQKLNDLEFNSTGPAVDLHKLADSAQLLVSELMASSDYLRRFAVVPVAVGGLDSGYRRFPYGVEYEKRYVMMIFGVIPQGDGPIFLTSGNFDLYKEKTAGEK